MAIGCTDHDQVSAERRRGCVRVVVPAAKEQRQCLVPITTVALVLAAV